MNYIWKNLRRDESGFTLIELLIVILVLGILAGIAVFASGPFIERANNACADANTKIALVADVATEAGVVGELYADAPDCTGTGTPGGGGTTLTVAAAGEAVDGTPSNPSVVTWGAPTAGRLLIAVTAHRQNVATGNPGTVSLGAGWTQRGVSSFMSSTTDRRAIAVFTKIADGTEGTVTATWTGAGITATSLVVSQFTTNVAVNTFGFSGTAGTAVAGTALDLGAATGNVFSGIVLRDGPATLNWTGAASTESQLNSGIGTHVAFGAGAVSASWTGAALASGFTLTLAP